MSAPIFSYNKPVGAIIPAALWYCHCWLFVMISKVAGTFILCACDVDKSQISTVLLSGPDISQPNCGDTAGEKTKPSSFKLMISSDFSKACSAGKGPHTSLSFHCRRCFCWGSIICYSLLWNLFQLSQITLLSSHYSLHFHNIHTPHIYIQTHTCKTECILKGFIIPLASIISTVLNLEGTVCISTVLFTLFLDNSN